MTVDGEAVFVEDLSEIPDTQAPVIFSAHGVPKSVPAEAAARNFFAIDATCPLVTKVHREAEIHHKRGRKVLLIGHAGHPEVVGTMGQLPDGAVILVQSVSEVGALEIADAEHLAYVTQTTLSLDDTAEIVAALKARYPNIISPHKQDICYATTNRQEAIKAISPDVDAVIVVGSTNSSNSQRLREVAERSGCPKAQLVDGAQDLDWSLYKNISAIAITAGASAPEVLVNEVIEAFAKRFDITIETATMSSENTFFPLPRELRENA